MLETEAKDHRGRDGPEACQLNKHILKTVLIIVKQQVHTDGAILPDIMLEENNTPHDRLHQTGLRMGKGLNKKINK